MDSRLREDDGVMKIQVFYEPINSEGTVKRNSRDTKLSLPFLD